MNSHSLASAIKQPFLLRRLNWISIALFCLWSLSPITGQALLRMCYIGVDGSITNFKLPYVNTTVAPEIFAGDGNDIDNAQPIVEALFGASIVATPTAQGAAMDAWGNPKIPRLDFDLIDVSDGYYPVGDYPDYSSLVGVPLWNISGLFGNTSLTIDSSYFNYDCSPLRLDTIKNIKSTIDATDYILYPGFDSGFNSTPNSTIQFGVNVNLSGSHGNIFFASQQPPLKTSDMYYYTNCTFNQSFVRSKVFCTNSLSLSAPLCAVFKMKPIPSPYSVSPLTSDHYNNWLSTMSEFGSTYSGNASYTSMEYFLSDSGSAGFDHTQSLPDLAALSQVDLTSGLSLLFNTYFQVSVSPYYFTGGFLNDSNISLDAINASATIVDTDPVYRAGWGWLSLVLFSSVVLLLGSVAGAICDARTVGPDIFGFASSLARNNKYMKVPDGGSAMSGPERARMLGNVKVMLQDVKGGAEVGKIALGTVDGGGQKLKPGRLYK